MEDTKEGYMDKIIPLSSSRTATVTRERENRVQEDDTKTTHPQRRQKKKRIVVLRDDEDDVR